MGFTRFARFAVTLFVASLPAAPAGASLIDLGGFSRDEAAGLDWLDLTQTARLSYSQVVAGEGGWISQGWRYATESEVRQFLTRYAGLADGSEARRPDVLGFLELLGATVTPPDLAFQSRAYGLYDDSAQAPYDLFVGRADIFLTYSPGYPSSLTWEMSNDMQLYHEGNRAVGSFLVRSAPAPNPIPEPASTSVALIALAGLGVLRQRCQHPRLKPGIGCVLALRT
jgi:hypothetical protein